MTPDSIESRLARVDEHMRGEIALINERLRETDDGTQRVEGLIYETQRGLERVIRDVENRLGTEVNVVRGQLARFEKRYGDDQKKVADEIQKRRDSRRANLKWWVTAIPALAGVIYTLIQILARGGA